MDAKISLMAPLTEWVDVHTDTFALCMDLDLTHLNFPRSVSNGVLAAAPQDATVEAIIRHVVANFHQHSYGARHANLTGDEIVLGISGPVKNPNKNHNILSHPC